MLHKLNAPYNITLETLTYIVYKYVLQSTLLIQISIVQHIDEISCHIQILISLDISQDDTGYMPRS